MIIKFISPKVNFKHFLYNRAIRILLITNSLILLASAMLAPIYALFVKKVGGDLLDSSLTAGMFYLAAALTVMLSAKYSDKIKRNELVVVFGYMVIGFGFFLYTVVNSIVFLLLVQAIIGFGEAMYAPAFDALYSYHIDEKKAAQEWGAWEATHYFTTAAGAVLGGVIVEKFGFNAIFITMGILCFVSALYIFLLPKRTL